MTNKDLAELIFPDIKKSIDDLRKEYPKRDTKGEVTRVAPSPTGFFHLGGMYQALIDSTIARNTDGVFYVRIEDTDTKRKVDEAVELIYDTLKYYDTMPNEYQEGDKVVGKYGPYVQSERKEIYQVFIKHLIEIDRAYPCFCSKEKLDEVRERQERYKQRTGYYGPYSTCRKLSIDEAYEKIKNGEDYIIRFRSKGNFDNKFRFEDLVKGRLLLPENDMAHISR